MLDGMYLEVDEHVDADRGLKQGSDKNPLRISPPDDQAGRNDGGNCNLRAARCLPERQVPNSKNERSDEWDKAIGHQAPSNERAFSDERRTRGGWTAEMFPANRKN